MILERIKKQLSLLTKGMGPAEKLQFLKTIGYSSFLEIQNLSDDERENLLQHLMSKSKVEYEVVEVGGYKISRPKEITSKTTIKDISFDFRGLRKE